MSGSLTVVTDGPQVGDVITLDVDGLDYVVRRTDGKEFRGGLRVEFYDDLGGAALPFRDFVNVSPGAFEVRLNGAVTALGPGVHYIQAVLMGTPVTGEAEWDGRFCLLLQQDVWTVPCTRSPVLTINVTSSAPPPGGTLDTVSTPDVVSTSDGLSTPDTQPGPDDGPAPLPIGSDDPVSEGNCGNGGGIGVIAACSKMQPHEAGTWSYDFYCPRGAQMDVKVLSDGATALTVYDVEWSFIEANVYASHVSSPPRVAFTSEAAFGTCVAEVETSTDVSFKVMVKETLNCHQACFEQPNRAEHAGCDCRPYCLNACEVCEDLGCNKDADDYACPFFEDDIKARDDCASSDKWDRDSFEHIAPCYRCEDGQQCCYTDGMDNGSGSFDINPPCTVDGTGDEKKLNCRHPFLATAHCNCDVIPLCGCMAVSGDSDGCNACIGTDDNVTGSCNAPGDDAEFCDRARDSGIDWCDMVGDADSCTDWKDDFNYWVF